MKHNTNKKITSYMEKFNKYFEQNKIKVAKKFDPNKNYKYKFYKDNNNNHIVQLYDDNNLVIEATYDIAGIYNIYNSIWYWGWNIDTIDRQLVKRSKKVKGFAKYIKNHLGISLKERDKLYYWSSNGNFYTSTNNVLHLIKLILYLTKSVWYLPVCYGKDSFKPIICNSDHKINDNDSKNINNKQIFRLEYILIKKIIKVH